MEPDLMSYGLAKIREHSLVTGGDAAKLGLLAMTDERWKKTADFMVSAGMLKSGTDYRQGYTLDLIKGIKRLP
jgi:NitT/TauT family transport system substrate-binding protein